MEKIKISKIIDRAKHEITGFQQMFETLEQKVVLGGLSRSTLLNYGRCIAKISLHFKCIAIELEEEQINGYLQDLLMGQKPSKSYFKHTVYGLRYLFRIFNLQDHIIKLPSLKNEHKLPVVLSHQECKQLFKSGRILKHRVMLCLIYSAGFRSQELRNLKIEDVDFQRCTIHIRQAKYNKDRYVPLSAKISKGLIKYMEAYHPKVYLFNGKSIGSRLSVRGVQWAMKEALKSSSISKAIHSDSLLSYCIHSSTRSE